MHIYLIGGQECFSPYKHLLLHYNILQLMAEELLGEALWPR